MNDLQLAKVDFDDIYNELMACTDELIDSDDCMRYLRASKNPSVKKWLDMLPADDDIHADVMAIIYTYLSSNDEYI